MLEKLLMFKDLWIIEDPIETPIGVCYFVKVKDYKKLLIYSNVLNYTQAKLFAEIKKLNFRKENNIRLSIDELSTLKKEMTNSSMIKLIKTKEYGLYNDYKNLFNLCFHEDVFDKIQTDEQLEFYNKLIKEMNHIEFEKVNPNPELAYYDKLARMVKERKGDIITFKTMVKCVGLYKDNVLDISINSLHEYFNQIGKMKRYDTTVLLRTVSNEIDIESWYKDDSVKQSKLNNSDMKYLNQHLNMIKNSSIKEIKK